MTCPQDQHPAAPRRAVFSRRAAHRALGGIAAGAAAVATSARASTDLAQSEIVSDELEIIAHRVFYGLDPVHELSAEYLRGVGAGEGLFRLNAYGDVEPELAQSSEMIDPFTWRVDLQPNVAFWSGKPVDARAVVESLERSRQLAPPAATPLNGIRIEPASDLSVVFRADVPIPGLLLKLADVWLMIHNAEAYGPQDNAFDLGVADLTGYFRVTEFETRVRALLVRNERYWGVAPRTPRIRFTEVVDEDARALAALSGEAHIVRLIPTTAARQVERSRTMRVVSPTSTTPSTVYLNTQKTPFDDVRVRQALAWAVDREEMALAYDGYATAIPSWLAAGPMYPEARRVGYLHTDVTKAAQLLDQAGWRLPSGGGVRTKDGAPLAFRLFWHGTNNIICEVLQAQWKKLGVQVTVQGAADRGFLIGMLEKGDWDALIQAWSVVGDPATIVEGHLAPDGVRNYPKFRDPALDTLLAGFGQLLDPEERRQHALRANELQAELVPFIPLIALNYVTAVSRSVRNYVPHFDLWGPSEMTPDVWAAT
jgi:peptide/nickel transport system substrate-binding protein